MDHACEDPDFLKVDYFHEKFGVEKLLDMRGTLGDVCCNFLGLEGCFCYTGGHAYSI